MATDKYDDNGPVPSRKTGIIKHYVRRYPVGTSTWDSWEHFFFFQSMTYKELTSSYNVDEEHERRVLLAFVAEMVEVV